MLRVIDGICVLGRNLRREFLTATELSNPYLSDGKFLFSPGQYIGTFNYNLVLGTVRNWKILECVPASSQPDTRKEEWCNDRRHDLYKIDIGNGEIEFHFKTNIELHGRETLPPTASQTLSRQYQ